MLLHAYSGVDVEATVERLDGRVDATSSSHAGQPNAVEVGDPPASCRQWGIVSAGRWRCRGVAVVTDCGRREDQNA